MKKILSVVMILALLLSMAVPASAAEASRTLTLAANKETVAPGETIDVTLSIDEKVTNLFCFEYWIYFNPDLFEVTAKTTGTTAEELVFGGSTKTDETGTYVRLLAICTSGRFDLDAGVMGTVTFTAKEGVSGDAGFALAKYIGLEDYDTETEDTASVLVNNAADVKVGYTVTVSDSENGSVTADKEVAAAGDTITLTPAPAEGCELDALTVTDAAGAAVTVDADNTFTMPASNVTVAATFKAATTIPVSGITLDQETLSLTAGETGTLKAAVTPENATDKTVTWSSSDENIATVADGTVTAVKEGTATITAKAGDVEATCTVKVEAKTMPISIMADGIACEVTEVSDYVYKVQIPEGANIVLTDTRGTITNVAHKNKFDLYNDEPITTDEGTIITDDGFYTIETTEAGATSITSTEFLTGVLYQCNNDYYVAQGVDMSIFEDTANKKIWMKTTAFDGEKIYTDRTIYVELIPAADVAVTGITLDETALTLTVGDNETLTATVTPENATDKTVTWSSSDETIATVADGTVTAVAAGTATITAKAGDVEATCTVIVTEKQEEIPAEGYSVTASEDVSITAGENAEVSITVTEADSKAYNAYELNITYPEGLTYVGASGSGVEGDTFQANHDEANRTIQIIGYGADKTSGTAAAKLTFTGSTAGEYDVTISSAKVDAAASAPSQDTPDATITDAAVKITVTGYTVTLGEGLTADSTVAYPGTNFTFKATDADNYDYTVTAKVGETAITVNNNNDGTYTIPGAEITGNINVSAVMNPKSYDVTYDGTTTENAATYNTPYTFTPAKEGYTVGGVTVTIGDEAYTGCSNENGTYTIPGADITGDIVITISWVEKTPETVTVNKGDGIVGDGSATKGNDYTFSFGDTDNYEYDEETLVVKVGDTDITDKVTKNEETGEYTIPGDLITGDITISIERTEKVTFTVEVSEYLTLKEGNKMYLVTVKGVEDGKVAKYDGQNMFWSVQTLTTGEDGEETTGYGAYAWLVISNEGLEAVKTAASEKVTTAEGTSDLTVDYSGDVNGTEKVDVNDAQLVYNMYKAYYGNFTTVSMQKFLDADVNSDKTVNSQDAAAVVAIITGK